MRHLLQWARHHAVALLALSGFVALAVWVVLPLGTVTRWWHESPLRVIAGLAVWIVVGLLVGGEPTSSGGTSTPPEHTPYALRDHEAAYHQETDEEG